MTWEDSKCPLIKGRSPGYSDDGFAEFCQICLNCPYPECLDTYGQGRGYTKKKILQRQRNQEIEQLFNKGKTPRELGEQFNLTPDSIRRILKEQRSI